MIILNTTFYVHESVDEQFRQWVSGQYFPSAIAEGKLTEPSIAKILAEPQEGMAGYAVQLIAEDMTSAQSWHDTHAADLRGQLGQKFGQRVLFFTTYMEKLMS